ncbi:hypothetical protein N7537_011395 [Penicillium hordei]|uniref:Uncharacterized protein n=1 Tax=Penicillium hordei TaxID=40994 RepID=A0AAD6DN14_9EURO|nr:uncharacterized protein N7537_011395 [Penicillium hordei]KAJ5588717.1 hypothetical protein N7537_011395 [Penicillium hordei]
MDGNRGTITLHNNCQFPLYVEGVAGVSYLKTELQPETNISDPFRLTINGTGNSVKVATYDGSSDITQIEYSACFQNDRHINCHPSNMIFYDISKINGLSNTGYGIRIVPSLQGCATVDCPSGVEKCDMVYYHPHDDYATKACDVRADLNVEFCAA